MYRLNPRVLSPVPEVGPVLLVCTHTSFSDPLVLSAVTDRSITYLVAKNIYDYPFLQWLFRAFHYIPVNRGISDVRAVRASLKAIQRGEVVCIFPEGGIDEFRKEDGYLGVGYLALKTGVPVLPVAIQWDQPRPLSLLASLLNPSTLQIYIGEPMVFQAESNLTREPIGRVTAAIMQAIQELPRLRTEPN